MIFQIQGGENQHDPRSTKASIRCPSCKRLGIMEPLGVPDLTVMANGKATIFGQRCCPNPQCRAHVFIIRFPDGTLITYPPERLDFDATNISARVVATFEEAITCHATNCFVAAAIMVRKTLEELCQDRGANGSTLKERLRELGNRIVLPKELLDGLDDLRLLGNDAAHIESQEYTKVGREEVEVGIEFAKEVLKAVYQYSSLLDKLRSLKKATP